MIVGVILFFVVRWLADTSSSGDDAASSTPSPPAVEDSAPLIDCAEDPCAELTIEDTTVNGKDRGVFIRSSPYDPDERRELPTVEQVQRHHDGRMLRVVADPKAG